MRPARLHKRYRDATDFVAEAAFSCVVECDLRTVADARAGLARQREHMETRERALHERLSNDRAWLVYAVRASRHWQQYGLNPTAEKAASRAYSRASAFFGIDASTV